MSRVAGLAAIGCLAFALPAQANVITINYASSGYPSVKYDQGYFTTIYNLVDAATGGPAIPKFTVALGDTIEGMVTFGTPVTVPGSYSGIESDVYTKPDPAGTTIGKFLFNTSYQYFDGATNVTPAGSNSDPFPGSNGALAFGGYTADPIPSFTFDRIVYSLTITGLSNLQNKPVTSGTFAGKSSTFEYDVVAFTPEPASWMLMILGMGAVGGMLRRRSGDRVPA